MPAGSKPKGSAARADGRARAGGDADADLERLRIRDRIASRAAGAVPVYRLALVGGSGAGQLHGDGVPGF